MAASNFVPACWAFRSKFTVAYGGTSEMNVPLMDVHLKVNKDGTVAAMSGGTEMGQGLTTKMAQTIAYAFGISVGDIRVLEQDTTVILLPN